MLCIIAHILSSPGALTELRVKKVKTEEATNHSTAMRRAPLRSSDSTGPSRIT